LKNCVTPAKFLSMEKGFFKDVEAILFDFEGTLVDFQWNLKGAVQETIEMLKVSGFSIERIQSRKYSKLINEAMEMAFEMGQSPDEIKEKISAIYDRYDEDALSRWTLRPKAKDFLFILKTKGVWTGLVSNVGKRALEKALQKMDIHQFFDVIISRNDVKSLKPSSEGIHFALTQLQVIKDRALFIGDSLDDIHAAKEAGLKVIIILGGENPKPDLLSAKPDFLIQTFDELIACSKEE
jgi:phosphoglycolate phosphatase